MKLLTVHSDFIEFEPLTKAVKSAEEAKKERKRIEECLVVFCAVEQGDDGIADLTQQAKAQILDVLSQIKASKVVLYPLVHLTSKPSPLDFALATLKKLEHELAKEKSLEVTRAPFGWYKTFTVKCKGHPLSELSREIKAAAGSPEEVLKSDAKIGKEIEIELKESLHLSDSLKKEAAMKSKFYIMDLKGELIPAEKFDYSKYPDLKKFADYEIHKVRSYAQEPPHIKLMKEHMIADYEGGSDSGNFRWYPSGRLIKKLLERHVTSLCTSYGAMEVETPIMYDFGHPALKRYLNRFPARQYVVRSDEKEFFLRFSACFGQFLMKHDFVISHKSLPLRMFELTRYSFRREQSGELAGLKRVRALTMPDMHTLAKDIDSAKKEFEQQFDACLAFLRDLDIDSELGFRIQSDLYKQNNEWYLSLVKRMGKPMLVEMFDERYAYFITKFELNFVDALGKASALSTVQIDVENADTFDISYVDADGQKKRPLILHASLSGSIERVVYALLEREAMRIKEGRRGMLPLWLSPTQVRIIPVSDRHLEYASSVLEQFEGSGVRADLDDRSETLGKKIRDAGKEWVPFIAVVGDKEMASGKLSVTFRENSEKKEMAVKSLAELIREKTSGKPFEDITLPKLLSKRPIIYNIE